MLIALQSLAPIVHESLPDMWNGVIPKLISWLETGQFRNKFLSSNNSTFEIVQNYAPLLVWKHLSVAVCHSNRCYFNCYY